MTTAATVIDNDISPTLNDDSHTTWSADERLAALNHAVRALVEARADQFATVADFTLAASTYQAIPADGAMFLGLPVAQTRNLEEANRMNPYWRDTAPADVPRAVFFDPKYPKSFQVFPPATGTGTVKLVYAKVPAVMANTSATVPVSDHFLPALVAYSLGVLFSKDVAGGKAPGYFEKFKELAALGIAPPAEAKE